MSATDDIRVLLGEHGVKCEIHDTKKRKDTRWDFRESSHAMFSEFRDGITVFVMSGTLWTPEEAIAATLGDGEYESKMDALLCQLTNGKWSMTRKYSLEFMESLVREEFEEAFAAESVTETCNADETDTIKCWVKRKDEPSTEHVELIHVIECSACGGTYEHVNGGYEFCPRCGRRVEVDE